MKLSKDIRHGRHCVSALHVHLVFVTKYRRKVFDADALERLQAIFQKVCRDFQVQLVEMNGEAEHVHLLINYQPKHSVSGMVNSLKGVSSRLLRSERPDLEKHYWRNVLWSPSYFAASCGGAPLDIIKQYVRQEKNPL
jgi:putative transposase